jgi:hypothetical protein
MNTEQLSTTKPPLLEPVIGELSLNVFTCGLALKHMDRMRNNTKLLHRHDAIKYSTSLGGETNQWVEAVEVTSKGKTQLYSVQNGAFEEGCTTFKRL